MLKGRHLLRLKKDKSGAAATEFVLISVALLLFTLGIMDVGFALYWFNRAEKATQLGVRMAAVSDPVSAFLPTFSGTGTGPGAGNAGDSCRDATGAIQPFCNHNDIVCTVSGSTGTCTGEAGAFNNAAFSKIFNEMRTLYPQLRSEQVEVEYRASALGFAGRPGNADGTFNLVPQITVRIVNLQYEFVALGSLLGLAPFTLPVISASISGEDMNHSTAL